MTDWKDFKPIVRDWAESANQHFLDIGRILTIDEKCPWDNGVLEEGVLDDVLLNGLDECLDKAAAALNDLLMEDPLDVAMRYVSLRFWYVLSKPPAWSRWSGCDVPEARRYLRESVSKMPEWGGDCSRIEWEITNAMAVLDLHQAGILYDRLQELLGLGEELVASKVRSFFWGLTRPQVEIQSNLGWFRPHPTLDELDENIMFEVAYFSAVFVLDPTQPEPMPAPDLAYQCERALRDLAEIRPLRLSERVMLVRCLLKRDKGLAAQAAAQEAQDLEWHPTVPTLVGSALEPHLAPSARAWFGFWKAQACYSAGDLVDAEKHFTCFLDELAAQHFLTPRLRARIYRDLSEIKRRQQDVEGQAQMLIKALDALQEVEGDPWLRAYLTAALGEVKSPEQIETILMAIFEGNKAAKLVRNILNTSCPWYSDLGENLKIRWAVATLAFETEAEADPYDPKSQAADPKGIFEAVFRRQVFEPAAEDGHWTPPAGWKPSFGKILRTLNNARTKNPGGGFANWIQRMHPMLFQELQRIENSEGLETIVSLGNWDKHPDPTGGPSFEQRRRVYRSCARLIASLFPRF